MSELHQDTALKIVQSEDMKDKLDGGDKIIKYLSYKGKQLKWSNLDSICDNLAKKWVETNNYKVALKGIDILNLLLSCKQEGFKQYHNLFYNQLVDRLGDQKEQVRDAAITLIANLMDICFVPQDLFHQVASEKGSGGLFGHRAWKFREAACLLLIVTLRRFGSGALPDNKYIPSVCKLVTDKNTKVRSIAEFTLGELFRLKGNLVQKEVNKQRLIPLAKKQQLREKFDLISKSDFISNGGLLEYENLFSGDFTNLQKLVEKRQCIEKLNEQGDHALMMSYNSRNLLIIKNNKQGKLTGKQHLRKAALKPKKIAVKATESQLPLKSQASNEKCSSARRPQTAREFRDKESSEKYGSVKSKCSATKKIKNAGGMDSELFEREFTKKLPDMKFFCAKDVAESMRKIFKVIKDPKKDWNTRAHAFKQIRALVNNGAYEEHKSVFMRELEEMEGAIIKNVKDLRSQVVKEACITVGYLSFIMKDDFLKHALKVVPALFSQIPTTIKVISSSSLLTIKAVLQNIQSIRMLPILLTFCSSKNVPVRRKVFALLDIVLQWPSTMLEKHILELKKSLVQGNLDADSETRVEARKCWYSFNSQFPREAHEVYNKLDADKQKLITRSPVQTKKSSKCLSNTTVHEESSAETSQNKTEKCTSVVVIENEAQFSSRSESAGVSSQLISSMESDEDCSLISSEDEEEEYKPPSSNKFKRMISSIFSSNSTTLDNKMKSVHSCSSEDSECGSFVSKRKTFCYSDSESVEVASSLETIVAEQQHEVDFREASIEETIKENIVTRRIMAKQQPQGGDCCFESKPVSEERHNKQSPLLEQSFSSRRKNSSRNKCSKPKTNQASIGVKNSKVSSSEVDTHFNSVHNNSKDMHDKFTRNTKLSEFEKRLFSLDNKVHKQTQNFLKSFEAQRNMTRDAFSSLSEQFAENFKQMNQSFNAQFKSLNKKLNSQIESLHETFDGNQSKQSNDDQGYQQILHKMTEQREFFEKKFFDTRTNIKTVEAACEEIENKLDTTTDLITEFKESFNSEIKNVIEDLQSKKKKQASSVGSSSDMQIILENLAVIESKISSFKLSNSIKVEIAEIVNKLLGNVNNLTGAAQDPDNQTLPDDNSINDTLRDIIKKLSGTEEKMSVIEDRTSNFEELFQGVQDIAKKVVCLSSLIEKFESQDGKTFSSDDNKNDKSSLDTIVESMSVVEKRTSNFEEMFQGVQDLAKKFVCLSSSIEKFENQDGKTFCPHDLNNSHIANINVICEKLDSQTAKLEKLVHPPKKIGYTISCQTLLRPRRDQDMQTQHLVRTIYSSPSVDFSPYCSGKVIIPTRMIERRQELEDICANRGRYSDANRRYLSSRKQSSQSLCPPRSYNEERIVEKRHNKDAMRNNEDYVFMEGVRNSSTVPKLLDRQVTENAKMGNVCRDQFNSVQNYNQFGSHHNKIRASIDEQVSLQSLSGYRRNDNKDNFNARNTSSIRFTNSNGMVNSMQFKPPQLKNSSYNSNCAHNYEKTNRSVNSLNKDNFYDDDSSSNSNTSVPNYDALNIQQINYRQSKSPPHDQLDEFVYNGNAEHYQSLDTENVYEDTNNNAAKRQSFTLFPSCGVINFSHSSDFESTLTLSEEKFSSSDDSISKIRSKYLTTARNAQSLNEKGKSCTLIVPYCNADLDVPYDTEKDSKKLNNFSAQKSCLFPSCGILSFKQPSDLELTMNKSEESIIFTNGYNNVKLTSRSQTSVKSSATMLEDFLEKYSNKTSKSTNLKEFCCSSVNLKEAKKTFFSTKFEG